MQNVKYILVIFLFTTLCILGLAVHTPAIESENNLSLGYNAYKDGNFEKAAEYLESAKKDDSVLSDYAVYYLGEAYLSLHRFDEALGTFKTCAKYYAKSPLTPSALERIGAVYIAKGDITNSIDSYKNFLKKYPNNPQTPSVIYKLVSTLVSHNRYDDAIPFIKKLLTEFPQTYGDGSFASQILSAEITKLNADEFYTRAKALLKARNYEAAVQEIKEYLFDGSPWFPYEASHERNDKLRLLLGQAFYQGRYFKKANEAFKEIFANTDDNKIREESLLWIARAYIKLKDFNSAKNMLEALIITYTESDLKGEAIYRLAMIAKDDGDTNLAVTLFTQLLTENSAYVYKDDALWQMGWIHYTNGHLEESINALKALENSSLKMRSLYWQGKIAYLLGKYHEAKNLFKAATDNFPPSYYSAIGRKALENLDNEAYFIPAAFFSNKTQTKQAKADNSLPIQRAQKLLKLGLNNLALKELAYIDQRQNPLEVSSLYKEAGDFYHSYLTARGQIYNPAALPLYLLAFPEAYKETVEIIAGKLKIDPFLIYAIMMQESEFDMTAVSRAGAIGLLQIMPITGKMIAQGLSHASFQGDDLLEPAINIYFGAWYLKTLITKFKGNLPLAIAAYNAGPNAVDEWLKKWNRNDMDEFIENIPYQETRKYVEKVLGYYEAYKTIYSTSQPAIRNSQSAQNFD